MNILTAGRRQVIFVRSGQTSWATENRFVGTTDLELIQVGHEAAIKTAKNLKSLGPTAILTSSLKRAVSTGTAIARQAQLSIRTDDRLLPPQASALVGLSREQILECYGDISQIRAGAPGKARSAGIGEALHDIAFGATKCIHETLAHGPVDEVLVIVTHDLTARAAICVMLDLPIDLWGTFEEMSYCAWSTIEQGRQGWRLKEHNILTSGRGLFAVEDRQS
jgi:broad specificity phosphatase PhoE